MTNKLTDTPHPFALGREIYEVSRTIRRNFDRRARSMGFTQAQWTVLLHLDKNEGISQSGLADIVEMQPISLARILDRMESAGLIERRPDPDDRRAIQLFLTPQAGPILKILHKLADEVRAIAYKGLDEDEIARTVAFLQRVRMNFGTPDANAEAALTAPSARQTSRS
jgi:MarR family transcriptional regulator, transcriptional regulator for hemolysin